MSGVGPEKKGQGRVFQAETTGRKRSWGGNELGTFVGKNGLKCGQREMRVRACWVLKNLVRIWSLVGGEGHKNFLIVMT